MKYVQLKDIIGMNHWEEITVTPENYFEILKFAKIANANKDVEIIINTDLVQEKYLDSSAFYGVDIAMLRKTTKSNGVMRYLICCNNSLR